jgi:DNA-binding response OmpR family regulator
MVVDDDPEMRDALAEALDARGFEAYPVASYGEAAAVARTWRPDVVVCDLHGTGDPAPLVTLGAPLLLSSGSGQDYLASVARRLGAAGTLRKPYPLFQLVAALDALRPAHPVT